MRIELNLAVAPGSSVDATVAELIGLGGWITDRRVEKADEHERLTFAFADHASQARFRKAALQLSGVLESR